MIIQKHCKKEYVLHMASLKDHALIRWLQNLQDMNGMNDSMDKNMHEYPIFNTFTLKSTVSTQVHTEGWT